MTGGSSDDHSFLIISCLTCVPFIVDLDLNFTTLLALFLLLLSGAMEFLLHSGHPMSNTPNLPAIATRKRGAPRLGG
jgi:hypothetical protein